MPSSPRPLSHSTGAALAAAGAASLVTAALAWLSSIASPCGEAVDATAAAELAGLQLFERASASYDEAVARGLADELDADAAEIAWGAVRDRYRLFLAYPEAVERWPTLAEVARERAGDLDELVERIVELQALEIQAEALAEAGDEMAAARELTARAHARLADRPGPGRTRLVLGHGPDCTLGAP